ncbi:hypothetical protein B566_EDAN014945 [Ephemera danica]|nr:hypothetical protein B566_EDAN014945 [Ephemera danica]
MIMNSLSMPRARSPGAVTCISERQENNDWKPNSEAKRLRGYKSAFQPSISLITFEIQLTLEYDKLVTFEVICESCIVLVVSGPQRDTWVVLQSPHLMLYLGSHGGNEFTVHRHGSHEFSIGVILLADVTQETRTGRQNETITYELTIKEVFKVVAAFFPPAVRVVAAVTPPVVSVVATVPTPAARVVADVPPLVVSVIAAVTPPAVSVEAVVPPPVARVVVAVPPPVVSTVTAVTPPVVSEGAVVTPPVVRVVAIVPTPAARVVADVPPLVVSVIAAVIPPAVSVEAVVPPPAASVVVAVPPMVVSVVVAAVPPPIVRVGAAVSPPAASVVAAVPPPVDSVVVSVPPPLVTVPPPVVSVVAAVPPTVPSTVPPMVVVVPVLPAAACVLTNPPTTNDVGIVLILSTVFDLPELTVSVVCGAMIVAPPADVSSVIAKLIPVCDVVTAPESAEGEARSLARKDGTFSVETNEWLDCRVFMEKGVKTLVTGYAHQGALNVDGCQFVRAWNHLSEAEKSGFRSQYYQQCSTLSAAPPRRG